MPHKKNANGRHHFPKMRHCVTNWREYDAGLRLLHHAETVLIEGKSYRADAHAEV